MKIYTKLVSNFVEVLKPFRNSLSTFLTLKDDIKAQLSADIKVKIETNELYIFLCDIYSRISKKIKETATILHNVFTISIELEKDFSECKKNISDSNKLSKKFIKNFKENFEDLKIYNEKEEIFINNLETNLDLIPKEKELRDDLFNKIDEDYVSLRREWEKINDLNKKNPNF